MSNENKKNLAIVLDKELSDKIDEINSRLSEIGIAKGSKTSICIAGLKLWVQKNEELLKEAK